MDGGRNERRRNPFRLFRRIRNISGSLRRRRNNRECWWKRKRKRKKDKKRKRKRKEEKTRTLGEEAKRERRGRDRAIRVGYRRRPGY